VSTPHLHGVTSVLGLGTFLSALYVSFAPFCKFQSNMMGTVWRNIKIKICRAIDLRVVLYGCETWSLVLMAVL
jgi:hypothetical protein